MRALLLIIALVFASMAHAEPPAPPSTGNGDDVEEADEGPGSCWAPLLTAGGVCLAVDAIGLAASGLGCALSQVSTSGGGSNCVEDCALSVVTAGVVLVGVIIAAVGLLVLGPLAAIAVTVAATIASAVAGRTFWAAALGGVPGVLVGVAGVGVAAVGLSQMQIGGNAGLEPGLFSGAPASALVLMGVTVAAFAGPLALFGAVGADLALTSLPDEEGEATPDATGSRRRPHDELPLPLALASAGVAY